MGRKIFLSFLFIYFLIYFSSYCKWVINKELFPVCLDFGDKKTPAAESFIKITQETIYNEKTGYGWEKKYNIYPTGTKDLTSTPNQTGLASTEEANLIINLKNGIYKGIITPAVVGKDIGRLYRYSLLGNEKVLVEKVELPERTFTVKVTDGKLKLTFKPKENGWIVHSIVLMPIENFLKAPEEFEKTKRLLIVGDEDWILNLQIPELKYKETPFPSFMKEDILIFKKSITDIITPVYRPEEEEILKKIEMKAAGDEYESYQFGIISKKPLPQLKFKISELKGPKTIPPQNITIRTQYYFNYKKSLTPKTLDLREETELIPNYTQGFWLTVYIPPDTPEGIYKGEISINGLNMKEKKIPVELTVLPFNLPQLKRHFYNIMWLGTYDTKPDSPSQEICKMAILDQKAHGINAFGCELRYPACNIYKEGDEIKFDLKPLEYRINFYKSLGINLDKNGKFIWLIGIHPQKTLAELTGTDTRILDKYVVEPLSFTDKFLEVYSQIVAAVEEYAKKNDLPEMYLFNIDEPYGIYKNKVALQLLKATKKGGGHPWVTVNDTYYQPLKEYLDVPVFANGYASYKTYEEYKKMGKKFWFYSAAPRGLRPVYARYETGIYLYKVGFEGATWFVYTWSLGNAYNGLSSMWNATHPGFWEFVPTISWECTREGIDDVRYMEFLEDLLNKNKEEKIFNVFNSLLDIVDPDINNFLHIDPITDVLVGKDASTWKSRDLDLMREFLQKSTIKLLKGKEGITKENKGRKLKDLKVSFDKEVKEELKTREVDFYSSKYICEALLIEKNLIKIDGEMEDLWKNGYKIENFVKLNEPDNPADDKTEVYILRDKENLYLFFKCFTNDMTKIKATITGDKRDIKEIWREDGIEIFIDPGCKYLSYYQLMINANGALTDMKVDIGEKKEDDLEWNSNAEVKTKILKDLWTAEIKIPFKSLGNYEIYGINFCRNNTQEKGTHTLWSPTKKASLGNQGFGVPERFGKLLLDKKEIYRKVKSIKGELVFQPLGVENKVELEIDKSLLGKKMDINIVNFKNEKVFEKNILLEKEKIEIPFVIYQDNNDPIYYLKFKCDDYIFEIPFKFLTKDINFFVFPENAFLIYSSDEKETKLHGSIKINKAEIVKNPDAKLKIVLEYISGGILIEKNLKMISNNFNIWLPIKDLDSGGYILKVEVYINPETVFKNEYKFLKL
ncbi:MAG TPA: DUF6067 family protein [bacterium]|nr:DUF6067 family protein [bacterium]HOM26020.1 DUF6067 family protein [bacterium]